MFKELDFSKVPEVVLVDVMQRIFDWMEQEGASIDDDYVKRQIEYAKRFMEEGVCNE